VARSSGMLDALKENLSGGPPPTPPSKKRRVLVWVLLVLAVLVLLVSSLTVWVQRQALDTDNWVEVSGQLLEDDDVRAVVASRLVDGLFADTDIEARIAQVLPAENQRLAAPVAGLVQQAAVPAADRLLQRPRTLALWEGVNRRAHERLVAILREEDEGRAVTTEGNEVVLDLRPLAERLAGDLGLQARLAPDAGQITIMEADELEKAQDAVQAIDTLSVWAVVLVVLLIAAALILARGFRREVVRGLAVGLIVVGVLLLVIRRLVGTAVVDSLTSPTSETAGWHVWLLGTSLLRDIALALVLYGVLLLIAAWIAGPSRWAVAVRRRLAPLMRKHPAMVYGVVALLFLLFLLWGPTNASRQLGGILILAALVAVGVEALRRKTLEEFPEEDSPAGGPAGNVG
jgi:ABC-type multidrug transport system fused ATPase/permease subunit